MNTYYVECIGAIKSIMRQLDNDRISPILALSEIKNELEILDHVKYFKTRYEQLQHKFGKIDQLFDL